MAGDTERERKRREEKRNEEKDACSSFPEETEITLLQAKNYFLILSEII